MTQTDTSYKLTPDEQALVNEFVVNAKALEQQASGALKMLCKMRGLEGDWKYDASTGILTKAESNIKP